MSAAAPSSGAPAAGRRGQGRRGIAQVLYAPQGRFKKTVFEPGDSHTFGRDERAEVRLRDEEVRGAHFDAFFGGVEYQIRTGLSDTAGDEAVTRGMALFRAYYAEHWRETTRPYPGIADLLDALTARHLTLAVLSNKPDAATQEVMSHTFARWRFDAVRGHRDGAPLKPDPAAALDIAAELDIAPDRWLYVGDTDVDMRTGTGAGMFAVGVTWGFRDEAELRESGARAIIADPAALLDWL